MEWTLDDIWGGVRQKTAASREAALAAQTAVEEAEKQAKAEITDMRNRILAGEDSTGNPLHDGLIVLYGERLYPSVVEKYECVDSALKQAETGEPVVAIRRHIESSGCAGFGGELHHHLERKIAMGILNGQAIQFDYVKKTASLPTSRYMYGFWSFHKESRVEEGPIVIDSTGKDYMHLRYGFQIRHLDKPIESLPGERVELPAFEPQPVFDTEILVGREVIREWLAAPDDNLARDPYFSAMRKLSKGLGIKPIEPATEWQKHNVEVRGRY